MSLTDTDKQAHVLCGGSQCPYCGSINIRAMEEGAFDGEQYEQVIGCENCDRKWRDIFTLSGIEEMS